MQPSQIYAYSNSELIEEIEKRGYLCKHVNQARSLSWNRTIENNFSEEAFKWEAVHKIAGQLTPDTLKILKDDRKTLRPIISARLYLF